jgi:hypothetical protein
MKTNLLFLLAFIPVAMFAQVNKVVFDELKSEDILLGEINTEGLKSGAFEVWFDKEYSEYNVNDVHFNPAYVIPFDSVYVFLGTWCSDSQREVPRFCKIMDHEYFKGTFVKYFALDGNKTCPAIDTKEYYVDYVPTFVFYYKGNELCRIIETPKLSLEEDIMDLLSRIQP